MNTEAPEPPWHSRVPATVAITHGLLGPHEGIGRDATPTSQQTVSGSFAYLILRLAKRGSEGGATSDLDAPRLHRLRDHAL